MSHHLRIKICGVTCVEDARAAVQLGADALGLNFYAPSPRCIRPETAAQIVNELPPFVEPVGLFVEETTASIGERLRGLDRIRTVQRHGIPLVPERDWAFSLIPAFAVRDAASLEEVRRHLDALRAAGRPAPAVLLDAHAPGLHGGTGRTAPWDLIADFDVGVPVILAGGLTPDNVAEAVRRVRPYAVDVASGVEATPGRKDVEKMRRFIEAAKNVRAGSVSDG
jgi:phosphoribosylanthranilate isomerase